MTSKVSPFLPSSACRGWKWPDEDREGGSAQRSHLLGAGNQALPEVSTCIRHETSAWAASHRRSAALERLPGGAMTGSVILPKMAIFEPSELRN